MYWVCLLSKYVLSCYVFPLEYMNVFSYHYYVPFQQYSCITVTNLIFVEWAMVHCWVRLLEDNLTTGDKINVIAKCDNWLLWLPIQTVLPIASYYHLWFRLKLLIFSSFVVTLCSKFCFWHNILVCPFLFFPYPLLGSQTTAQIFAQQFILPLLF